MDNLSTLPIAKYLWSYLKLLLICLLELGFRFDYSLSRGKPVGKSPYYHSFNHSANWRMKENFLWSMDCSKMSRRLSQGTYHYIMYTEYRSNILFNNECIQCGVIECNVLCQVSLAINTVLVFHKNIDPPFAVVVFPEAFVAPEWIWAFQHNTILSGCFCPWTFSLNIGLKMLHVDSLMSCLNSLLGYSTGEFQALILIFFAVFGAMY